MKLAHIAIVTPHRAGLYETVRDLCAAERAAGVDARIVDPKSVSEDRGVPVGQPFDPGEYDAIINHSGLGQHESRVNGTPVIHCLHGRPESSFRLTQQQKTPVYQFVRETTKRPAYKRWVTFWQETLPYWSMLVPDDKLRAITPPVDLAAWTPDGPTGYQFHGKRGEINVVCADLWREDRTPYHVIHGFCEFAKSHPGSNLHLYGVHRDEAINVLLEQIEARGWLGEVCGYVTGLANVYRAATMAISPHRIATRSIREAMACGCPVVCAGPHGFNQADPEWPVAFAHAMKCGGDWTDARESCRVKAEETFDSHKTATEMLAIVREVCDAAD